MSQKFEEFQLGLNLRQVSNVNPWARDPVVRLTDPKPAVNIVDADLDYDTDELMESSHEDEFIEVDIHDESMALSGVDPMEVELEDIRMKAVQDHYTKPSWVPGNLLDRLFCCAVHVM